VVVVRAVSKQQRCRIPSPHYQCPQVEETVVVRMIKHREEELLIYKKRDRDR
jgi:hypothetical protein